MKLIILSLWLLVPAINIYWDRNGRKPNYAMMFILRGMAAILHGVVMDMVVRIFPEDLYRFSSWELIVIYLPLLTYQLTSFWLLFEAGLNFITGKSLLYYDTVEKDSGWIDRLFAKLGYKAHIVAKLLALILCILSIVVILNQ